MARIIRAYKKTLKGGEICLFVFETSENPAFLSPYGLFKIIKTSACLSKITM